MATFNYIRAVWRNGPGVVSDAPDWALAAIERALARWLNNCEHEFVGVCIDRDAALDLRIFVSPWIRSRMGARDLRLAGEVSCAAGSLNSSGHLRMIEIVDANCASPDQAR